MTGPTVIAGRYVLGRLLGAGGMAQVFHARDQLLGRDVAVKIFGASIEAHGPDRIQAEIRTLARLSHPALVTVHDAGTDTPADGGPERAFLVMELIDGPTLAQLIVAGPVAPELVAAVGAGTAAALAEVHAQGVVHRDVKPANILLDAQSRPHLADFGIAQSLGLQAMTAPGLLMGTAPYLSPEQVQGLPITAATDIYSLGLVLLEALTGRREYPGLSAETALARLSRPPVVDAALAAPWPELLAAMTASDPGARPAASEVAETLGAPGVDSAVTTMLALPADDVAPTTAAPQPTRLLTGYIAPPAELARSTWWAAARQRASGNRFAVVVVATAASLVLVVAAAAALDGSGGASVTPTPTPVVTHSSAPTVRATPSPTRSASARPDPGKGKGHGKGK